MTEHSSDRELRRDRVSEHPLERSESKPVIILVDDDPMIGRCLTMFLDGHNYRVIFFTDGNKALGYLKNNNVNNPSPILSPEGRGKGEGGEDR